MIYHDGQQWQFCSFLSRYKKYGKVTYKYVQDKEYWANFVDKWWHLTELVFYKTIPTPNQQSRLNDVNGYNPDTDKNENVIPSMFASECVNYVEAGVILDKSNPYFSDFTQNPEVENTVFRRVYMFAVEDYLDRGAAERDYASILHLSSYSQSTITTWQQEGLTGLQWRDNVWVKAFRIMNEVVNGTRTEIPTVQEFLNELPWIEWPT